MMEWAVEVMVMLVYAWKCMFEGGKLSSHELLASVPHTTRGDVIINGPREQNTTVPPPASRAESIAVWIAFVSSWNPSPTAPKDATSQNGWPAGKAADT
jgi:hypothetical protein